jgi:hypothetical protein
LVKFQDLLNPGTFSSAVKYRVGDQPLAVATDDINGDGLTDLVTANSQDDNISRLIILSLGIIQTIWQLVIWTEMH